MGGLHDRVGVVTTRIASAGGVEVALEVADIIRAADEASRARAPGQVRRMDRAVEALDRRLARIEGALAVADRTGRDAVWYHPHGLWRTDRLRAVWARVLSARASIVEGRLWWRDRAEEE